MTTPSLSSKALPTRARPFLAGALALLLALACSGGEDGPSPVPGAAGSSAGNGGTAPVAGQSSSAGTTAVSGSGSGGAAAGSSAGGSSSSGTGGAAGTTTGGTGGATAGSGGAPLGGAGGGASGGASAGAGGSGGMSGQGSPGCGSASPLKSGNFTENINGTMREYVLDVPADYSPNKKYRLVFVWHPLGGSASSVVSAGYNGLKSLSQGSAIFVAANGLMGSNGEANGRGWWNANNGDMLFVTALLAKLQSGLCIDNDRIFSTGFSFGGMMSYTVGYEFDVFRAIAPCSGDLQVIPHKETYTRPLPIMAFHGDKDDFVTTARGRAARDKYLARNKCGTETKPASPSPCVEYQGCMAPTFWCEFPGGHNTWSEEPAAIWKFFSQF